MSNFRVFLPIFIVLGLILGGLYVFKDQLGPSHTHAAFKVGDTLPDFDLFLYPKGQKKRSELAGKIYFVNFWASWCEACMIEIPSILKLREKYQSMGLEVLFLNVDENPDVVIPPILEKFRINFPIYLDFENRISDLFDVHAIPFTAFFDKSGKVLFMDSGERDWFDPDVQKQVELWLSK